MRPGRRRALRPSRAVLGAALVTLLVACGGGPPEGWTAVELDGLSFARPSDLDAEPPGVAEAFWEYGVADRDDLLDATMVLRATGNLGDDEFSHVGVSRLLVSYRHALPGFGVVEEAEIEVEGASSASRVRYRYEADDGREVEGVWLVASDLAQRRSAAVNLVARNLDDEVVRELEQSLRMRPREGDGDGEETVQSRAR